MIASKQEGGDQRRETNKATKCGTTCQYLAGYVLNGRKRYGCIALHLKNNKERYTGYTPFAFSNFYSRSDILYRPCYRVKNNSNVVQGKINSIYRDPSLTKFFNN